MIPGAFRPGDAWTALALVLAVGWFFAPLLRGDAIVAEPDVTGGAAAAEGLPRALARGARCPLWNPTRRSAKPFLPDLLAGALTRRICCSRSRRSCAG